MATVPMFVTLPGAGVLSLIALGIYLWVEQPGFVLYHLTKIGYWRLGLTRRKVKAAKYTYSYVERGRPQPGCPSLLLIHGFSANKDMYLPVAQKLPRDLHLVIVDQIGHGDTDLPEAAEDLTLTGLSRYLKEFVDAVGLNKTPFHLLGTSLGGAVSAVYTAQYPADVELLSLCCPAMSTPISTMFQEEVREGKCRLLPTDLAGVEVMLLLCLFNHEKVPVSQQVLKGLLQQRMARQDFYVKLFGFLRKEIQAEQERFLEEVSKISVPTQVIWGKQDEILHVSGTEILKSKLPNCTHLDILDKCGHVISMDRPYHMTQALLAFRMESKHKRA